MKFSFFSEPNSRELAKNCTPSCMPAIDFWQSTPYPFGPRHFITNWSDKNTLTYIFFNELSCSFQLRNEQGTLPGFARTNP